MWKTKTTSIHFMQKVLYELKGSNFESSLDFIFKKANVRSIYIYSWYFLEGCQYSILWNFVTRIMNWNLCSSFFLWAYCVHWMHYKDENITRNIFMNLILAKELPFKLLIIKEACHALHIITLKKVMIAIYSQMMNE